MRRTRGMAVLGSALIVLAAGCGSKKVVLAATGSDDDDRHDLGSSGSGSGGRNRWRRSGRVRIKPVVRVDEELRPARLARFQAHELGQPEQRQGRPEVVLGRDGCARERSAG